jgi:hypothetical protein
MLRGGQHGQHGGPITVGVALSSAEDALTVLPQDREAAVPVSADFREIVH